MKIMQTPKCFLAGSSVYTQTRESLAVYVMLLCKWRLRSCNISRVEHSSWLDRDHRNPMVMDLQKLRMSLLSLCPQHFSYCSPNPVVFHSYQSQPIMLFLHHHFSGFCPAFPPIYSHWVSTNWATWMCSVDWCPCVQQPALLHAQPPRLLCCFTGILHPKGHQCSTTIWKWTWWRQPGGQLSANIYQAFSKVRNLARPRCFVSKIVNFNRAGKCIPSCKGSPLATFGLEHLNQH